MFNIVDVQVLAPERIVHPLHPEHGAAGLDGELGHITETPLAEIFTGAGVEHQPSFPLSKIAFCYNQIRAFWIVAKKLKLKRQDSAVRCWLPSRS